MINNLDLLLILLRKTRFKIKNPEIKFIDDLLSLRYSVDNFRIYKKYMKDIKILQM